MQWLDSTHLLCWILLWVMTAITAVTVVVMVVVAQSSQEQEWWQQLTFKHAFPGVAWSILYILPHSLVVKVKWIRCYYTLFIDGQVTSESSLWHLTQSSWSPMWVLYYHFTEEATEAQNGYLLTVPQGIGKGAGLACWMSELTFLTTTPYNWYQHSLWRYWRHIPSPDPFPHTFFLSLHLS